MIGELLGTQTKDGLTLHGMLIRSDRPANEKTDLVVFVHGVGSNFYQSSLVRKTYQKFLDAGISLLSINTRGHDFVFSAGIGKSQVWMGSANEIVDDCLFDIDAWVVRADKLGFQNVSLLGHSLGAVKTIYSQSLAINPLVKKVVAVSPSCLSCSYFQKSHRREEFQKCLDWAEGKVAEGQASQIGEVTFPFRLMMSPGTFVDKYGAAERYNILKLVKGIKSPMLIVLGEHEISEGNPAFENLDERLQPITGNMSNVMVKTLADADHHYSGVQNQLADLVIGWINSA